jgi:hypothetical protein
VDLLEFQVDISVLARLAVDLLEFQLHEIVLLVLEECPQSLACTQTLVASAFVGHRYISASYLSLILNPLLK